MDNIGIFITGISIVVSIFLLAVTYKSLKRSNVKIFYYLFIVFGIILIANAYMLLQVFGIVPYFVADVTVLLFADLVILLLFYFGIVRGSA